MFTVHRKEIEWGGRRLILETGKVARQAAGSVVVQYGDTIVLCTATAASSMKPGIDFFPLTVNYQEKTFAAGKIPGGFFKREGRPSEKEVLTSRLIDRPIRPLFAEGFRNETQVIATVLSHDLENNPDIVGHDRRVGGADHFRPAVPRPDRRRPRRPHRRPVRAEPARGRGGEIRPRPGRRRHIRWRADGGVRGQGALGRDHAGRRDVRP